MVFFTLVSKQSNFPSHGIKATDDDLYLKVIATYNLVEIVHCEVIYDKLGQIV